jgi:ferredoxin, 2Fe-2S
MPDISFLLADGTQRQVRATAGISVMRAAIDHGVPGIEADCGGSASCGTCHVFVDDGWVAKLPPPGDNELTLLEFTAVPAGPTSRLSCQIIVQEDSNGAAFRIPERQT